MIHRTMLDRFVAKVAVGDNDQCWPWLAYRNKLGYGCFAPQGCRPKLAHRVAWELAHSASIPERMLGGDGREGRALVLHTCDNPACVNPAHLQLGTDYDNVVDMEKKGRSDHPSGARHGNAVLTAGQVAEIRRLRSFGLRLREIASMFGIQMSEVSKIARYETWNSDTDTVSWRFVDAPPAGPWLNVVTHSGVSS